MNFKVLLCSVFLQLSVIEPHSCYGMKCKTGSGGGSGEEFGKNVSKTNFPLCHVIHYVHTQ